MKQISAAILLALSTYSLCQDTITVQTFTYDSIETRRAIFNFPSQLPSLQFEKVLMYYNIKCSPLTPWDSYNCGEWDYLAYSQIWQHTGAYDSVEVNSPHYLVNGQNLSNIAYSAGPYYNYYQHYQKFITYSLELDTEHQIGSDYQAISYPFGSSNETQHTQLLFTATELLDASVVAGEIAKIRFDVEANGGSMGHLTVKMKHTSATELNEFDLSGGWTTVYDLNTSFASTGLQTINLTYPFLYNGYSSVLIDISFENPSPGTADVVLNATQTPVNTVVHTEEKNGYLNIIPGKWVDVDLDDYDFQNEITITFWAFGNDSYLPTNTSVLEGYDSLNHRLLNIHFPWSDETIYWDSGKGSGYDRIQKAATPSEYEGEWHHWAFTKNAADGTMKIYKDGVLWHSGTGKNLEIGVINKFRIGNSLGGNYQYGGKIDEFAIFDQEISATDIGNWMNQKINSSHPNYGDLVLYYDFDNETYIADKSGNYRDGMMTASNMVVFDGTSHTGYDVSDVRPNVSLVQGTYNYQLDSVLVTDSVLAPAIDILEYAVDGRKFVVDNIIHTWPTGFSYTYNYLGQKTDSVFHSAINEFPNSTLTYYEEPFEVVIPFEIGRFITPYGIGFDLGPNGFTYVYDVTDYQSLLMGDVDFSAHNTQELIDVKFVFITGTPPRDVLGVKQLWNGLGSYSYSSLDNNTSLPEIDVDLDPNGEMYKLRTRITGHGHNGSVNCCEWGNGEGRDHEILIDGTSRFLWEIWQETECGDNPNMGQGGTWPYAREGWCPGDKVTDYEFDITPYVTPGTTTSIDYDIEDVPATDPAQGNGNYVISMHLITYGEANFTNDAAIVDVLNPNDWEYYGKWNPSCQNPRIILQNTGSNTLTSAEINIWIGEFGNNVLTYTWTGDLEFLEKEIVEIPVEPYWWNDYLNENTFTAQIYKVNGVTDDYENNNKYKVSFEPAPVINQPFYIWFKTNNKAVENDLFVRDQDGNIVFSRTDLTNTTEYKDTLYLTSGCYTVEITDSDHDGLGFWYSAIPVSDGGEGETSGFLRLRKVGGSMIYIFPNDFGHYAKYTFSVGFAVGMEETPSPDPEILVYPNPNKGTFNLRLDHFTGDQIAISLYNEMGELVYTENIPDNNTEGYLEKTISLGDVTRGIYYLRVTSDGAVHTERIVVN